MKKTVRMMLEEFLVMESVIGAVFIALMFLATIISLENWRVTIFQIICWVCIKELVEWYFERLEKKEQEKQREKEIEENWKKVINNK